MAAIQRKVVLAAPRQDIAGSSNAVSELVLYDPEEHRLQWLAQQEANAAAAAVAAPGSTGTDPSTADVSPQVEPTAAQAAGQLPPTAPSAPASTSAAGMAWEKRVKVYADPFLVEKLRPHQKEGAK